MRLEFGLVCEDVRFEVGGKISIIGESNLFQLPKIPLTIPFCVVTKWSGSAGSKGLITLQMVSPDSLVPVVMAEQDLTLGEIEFDTSFGGTVNKLPWQFQTTGVHTVQIQLDGEERGRVELLIKRLGPG